jgi:uncharacterized protein (TIGR02301 family)
MARFRISFLLPVALGAVVAAGLVPLAAGGAAAGPDDRTIRLAQFDDPSLPSYVKPSNTRRRVTRREPSPAPFALPTAPISAPRAAPGPQGENPGIPGENEFPPYEHELLRLAEILGAVQYLRDLCGAGEGTQWRDRMQDLIASEDPNPAWRMRLMDNYNRGYQAYERTYHGCTPAAARAAEIYVAEGKDLTGTIKARYAN